MAVNPKKLLEAFRLETEEIPERVKGYRDELMHTLADILFAEREHAIRRTQIQKEINEYCDRLGKFLADRLRKRSNE